MSLCLMVGWLCFWIGMAAAVSPLTGPTERQRTRTVTQGCLFLGAFPILAFGWLLA